eukprot:s797_g27.t1
MSPPTRFQAMPLPEAVGPSHDVQELSPAPPSLLDPGVHSNGQSTFAVNPGDAKSHGVWVTTARSNSVDGPSSSSIGYECQSSSPDQVNFGAAAIATQFGGATKSSTHQSCPIQAPGASSPGVGSFINDPGFQKRLNSQRTGRQNLEEKKSGKTNKQPATGTQRPVEQKLKQPASRPPEPEKMTKQPAEGTQGPPRKIPMSPPTRFHAMPLQPAVGPSHDDSASGPPRPFDSVDSPPMSAEQEDPPLASHADEWSLGAFNPSGIAGKIPLTKNLMDGIYAISESHLTIRGKSRFDQELKHHRSKFHFVGGAPAPYKKSGMKAIGGKHTGVGFLSSFPFRKIQSGWNEDLYTTGRLCCATFQVGNYFVAGAVVYGFAAHADTKEVQAQTNQLLVEVSRQVVDSYPGPAFVAGDFNQSPGVLPEQIEWERRGWCDIQTWIHKNFGIAPGHTCRYRTRKDYIMLSPAMQTLLLRGSNEYDRWPDHSSLMAVLRFPEKPRPIARWRSPKAIRYDEVTSQTIHHTDCQVSDVDLTDPTAAVTSLSRQFEDHVHATQILHGSTGLTPAQRGRSQTLSRSFPEIYCSAVKQGRSNDPAPQCTAWSITQMRWLTQWRRLHSYAQHVQKATNTPQAILHGHSIWKAVLRAPGFGRDFRSWWETQAKNNPSWLPWCPVEPPAVDIAHHFAETMGCQYRALEAALKFQSIQHARKRRIDDPNRIFQDLRKAPPAPVQMLLAQTVLKVQEAPDSASVIVDDTTDIDQSKPIETTSGPLSILHVEEGQIWFDTEHALSEGDTLTQTSMQGDVPALHEAFLEAWKQRWDAHRNLPDDHWDELINFVQASLPPARMELRPLTVERWYRALKSKKARSAQGMDSVARADLLAMPMTFHAQIVRLLNHVETTGSWPCQWLDGAVHSLAKVDSPEVISHFRPVTVMPLIYRTYTSMRSRELLHHISSLAPDTMYGNRPNRTALNLWWSIQERIELALYQEAPTNGIICDIIKAFNCIPRLPVFGAACAIGVPDSLITAWSTASTMLKRYFFIQGSPSPPATSCTGFVEGCGLSVCAMSLLNLVVHRFMQLRHPAVTFLSYVDNYELEAWCVNAAQRALESLDQFCSLLDVSLDHKKTIHWATAPGDRKILRHLQISPARTCRDLGGQMSYTSCRNNSMVIAKLAKLEHTWHQLARSHAPLTRKFQVLRIVTWPRALHAASTVHIGPAHFDSARAHAMQALGLSKMGANPQIQLALINHPMSDPEFFVVWDSIMQARRNAQTEIFNLLLTYAAQTAPTKVKPGPAGVLFLRLFQLGWKYEGDGVFRDTDGHPLHLWTTPLPEVKQRVTRSYTRYVGEIWSHRKDFDGLQHVHPKLSAIDRTAFSLDEVGALRTLQNGTMFTNDCLVHIDGPEGTQTSLCKFCGREDSMQHRHWECPSTQFSRDLISGSSFALISSQPDCTRNRGWMTEPAALRQFKSSLYTIPAAVRVQPFSFAADHLDFFTDGSGLDPAIPEARLVGWGVVIAGESPFEAACPVGWGGVHGEWQTVPRAETTALWVALSIGQHWPGTFSVWGDNELVVQRARAIQQGTLTVNRSMADHDLWMMIQDIIPSSTVCTFQLVRSHQDSSNVMEWEAWAFRMNEAADQLAQYAIDTLPNEVLSNQKAAAAAYRSAKDLCQVLHQHFVRIASLSVTAQDSSVSKAKDPVNALEGMVHWSEVLKVCCNLPPNLTFSGVDKVFRWMAWFEDRTQPIVSLSWYETLWSYQLFSQTWGVQSTSCHNTWKERSKLHEYDAVAACREWRNFLTHLIKRADQNFVSRHHRPTNPRFQSWSMGIQCSVSEAAKTAIATWLRENCGDNQITTVKQSLANLPPATNPEQTLDGGIKQFGIHRFLSRPSGHS